MYFIIEDEVVILIVRLSSLLSHLHRHFVIECDQRVRDAETFLPLSLHETEGGEEKQKEIFILLCDNTNVNKKSVSLERL